MAAPRESSREPVRHELRAGSTDIGRRLDVFIAAHLAALSRAQVQRLIREGRVLVSRGPAKAAVPVLPGLVVTVEVPAPEPAGLAPEPLALRVLYEDDDIAVIDKPAGVVVHPGAGHRTGTLVHGLLHQLGGLSGIGGAERPGIVHRLDRGTSGVMVVAKHDRAHRELSRQFREREVGKTYVALVWGRPASGLTIDRPLGRDPKHRQRISSRARHARAALTRILKVEPLGGVSLVRVVIGTGRTHQIRVHLSEAGFPVVGDRLYGGVKRVPSRLAPLARLERPFLHAETLSFRHPADGRPVTFTAPLPPDLVAVLEGL
jgi:23S rRNA pseudouridine1911/1915/1917 synthase